MAKGPQEIANEIITLVSELVKLAGVKVDFKPKGNPSETSEKSKLHTGATGGIRLLLSDGFFEEPRKLSQVRNQLKTEGRYYPNPSISMGLLNLVRDRKLIRIQEQGKKTWLYVVRR